ncbi:MAG TPA: lipopolysaccharide biosynthesis protein [Blastocatellia bacterium]|nr:lipopolysaccharide biosynthesis protein [Blastocatellia bacterium]
MMRLLYKTKPAAEANRMRHSLTVQAIGMMFAKMVAFGLSLLLPLLLVRWLSQDQFGTYKQIFLIITTAMNVLPFGVAMSAYYFLPRERERKGQVVFHILLFNMAAGALACAALVLYPGLLEAIFNDPHLAGYSGLIGLTTMLWITSSFLETVAVANQELRLASAFIISSQFTKTSFLIIAALFFTTVEALIYAALVQGILQTIILFYYLRSRFAAFWKEFNWPMMRTQFAYAMPFGLATMLMRVQFELDYFFVAFLFDPAAFAIYAIGRVNLPLIGILTESVGAVTIPRVSQLQEQEKFREILQLIAAMARKLAAILFPLFVFLLLTGRDFIIVLYTAQYAASWPIFAINLTLVPLRLVTSGCDPVIRAYAEHRYFLIRVRAVIFLASFASLWLATTRFGMLGAVTVMVITTAIERTILAIKVGRILNIKKRDAVLFKDLGKLAIAAIAAGAATLFVRALVAGAAPPMVLAVCGVSFAACYFAAILLLGIPTPGERRAVWRRVGQLQRFSPWKRATEPLA